MKKNAVLVLLITPLLAWSDDQRARNASPGPPIAARISTQCLGYPWTYDPDEVGIGQQLRCWISSFEDLDDEVDAGGKQVPVHDQMGNVIWAASGGTVFPCLSNYTIVTSDLNPDTVTNVSATIDDANVVADDEPILK